MPDSKVPNLTTKLDDIKVDGGSNLSTTAKLFVIFVKTYFDVPDRVYDSVLARSARVYVGFGEVADILKSLGDDAALRAHTREILEKLKTIGTPSVKAIYESLVRDANPALEQSEALTKRAELLHQRIETDRENAFKALDYVLKTEDSQQAPVLNQLIMAEKTRQSVRVELDNLEKAHLVSNALLRKNATTAFMALPDKEKTNVSPIPPAPTRSSTLKS